MIIKEEIIEINYYSPPGLKRHRFFISTLEKRTPVPGTPSGILMEELRQRDRAASGLLETKAVQEKELSGDERIERDEFNDFVDGIDMEPSDETEEAAPKRKFRALKRIEELIYDDTAVKQGELEDEAYELLNKDGYYDEMLPIDYDEDAPESNKTPMKSVFLYLGILFVMVAFVIWYLKFIVF